MYMSPLEFLLKQESALVNTFVEDALCVMDLNEDGRISKLECVQLFVYFMHMYLNSEFENSDYKTNKMVSSMLLTQLTKARLNGIVMSYLFDNLDNHL